METQVASRNIIDTRAATFKEVVGQDHIKEYLTDSIRAWHLSRTPLDHTLFLGSKGLGKTTLANALANEAGVRCITVMGSDLRRLADFTSRVLTLRDGDIIFIEETHLINPRVQEQLLVPMEQYQFEGYNASGGRVWIKLPKFVIIGATTDGGDLLGTFLDRFGYKPRLMDYTVPQLVRIITERAQRTYGIAIPVQSAETIATLSRKTSRNAINLLASVIRSTQSHYNGKLSGDYISVQMVNRVLKLQSVDPLIGLDSMCRAYLRALVSEEEGHKFGMGILATMIKESEDTVKHNIEPYLVSSVDLPIYSERNGEKFFFEGKQQDKLVKVTSRGRVATLLAYKYLDMCKQLQVTKGWFPGEDLG